MSYRDIHDLTGFADILGKWHAPEGFTYCVGIVAMSPGPQKSAVSIMLEYAGDVGVIVFPAPVKPAKAYKMLRASAEMMVGRHPERN